MSTREKSTEKLQAEIWNLRNKLERGQCKDPFALRATIDKLEKKLSERKLVEHLAN